MGTKYIPAIFESGTLRPLAPLDLDEQERVEVVIVRAAPPVEEPDEDYVPNIVAEADPTVTLEQVHRALAKIPGSLEEDFSRQREDRF